MRGPKAAQEVVCTAAATIQFMEASGLRPAAKRIPSEWMRLTHSLPGRDHSLFWIDPATGQIVFSDEPYKDSPEFLAERTNWAKRQGMILMAPKWPGMYVPGQSALYLLAREDYGPTLAAEVRKLDALPNPPVAEDWKGESAPYSPVFVTPARQASGRVKRSRPRHVYPGMVRKGAVAYGRMFVGMQWRPHGKMPLASHKRIGELLKALLDAGAPSAALHRIDGVRSDLDEWIQREFTTAELPHEQFSEMYYGSAKAAGTDKEAMVDEVTELLSRSYLDCGPLRQMLRTLTSVRKSIESQAVAKASRQDAH